MASINKVILIGGLGKDPEVRTTKDGKKIVSLSVATSDTWKDKSGQKQERTEWHKVIIFNPALADIADKYARKGSRVYIEGSLQTRKYTNSAGQDVYVTEVVVSPYTGAVVLLDSKKDTTSSADYREAKNNPPEDPFDDSIPF